MTPAFHITLARLINRAYLPAFLTAPADVDLTDLGYRLTDVIYGTDKSLIPPFDPVVTPYGFLAINVADGTIVAVIRGTNSAYEWFKDFEAALEPSNFCPGCQTELGFTDIYKTLSMKDGSSVVAALAGVTGLTCTGHSLGGPLATMLAAQVGAAALVCWASPKPGNTAFAEWVRSRVPSIDLYVNVPDVVPHSALTIPPWERFIHVDALTIGDSRPLGNTPEGFTDRLHFAHSLDTYIRIFGPANGV